MQRKLIFFCALVFAGGAALGGDGAEPERPRADGYRYARPGYVYDLRRDLRPRPAYRTNWWYYTGHLRTRDGRRFGFQYTIFKIEQRPDPQQDYRRAGVYYMVHAAVSDRRDRRYVFNETLQRFFPGIAGYDEATRTIYVEGNTLRISADGRRHELRLRTEEIELDLELTSERGAVYHGENGASPKGTGADSYSHYFSIVDLRPVRPGRLAVRPHRKAASEYEIVEGAVWMDVEFASNALAGDQIGWDWLHASLENGERFMLFRVRSEHGAHYYSGTYIAPDGRTITLTADHFTLNPGETWTSPRDGAIYPLHWTIEVRPPGTGRQYRLDLEPWFAAQEAGSVASRTSYWEGAVDVTATVRNLAGGPAESRNVRGLGYLELTGYGESMRGRL